MTWLFICLNLIYVRAHTSNDVPEALSKNVSEILNVTVSRPMESNKPFTTASHDLESEENGDRRNFDDGSTVNDKERRNDKRENDKIGEVADKCATGSHVCDSIGGVCTYAAYGYTCECKVGFWDKDIANPGRQCIGCCKTVDFKSKKTGFLFTSCTLNTDAISKYSDKWVYECIDGYLLEYIAPMKKWYILKWEDEPGSFTSYSKTTEIEDALTAEGKCFPPALTFDYYSANCHSRVGDEMTVEASSRISRHATTIPKNYNDGSGDDGSGDDGSGDDESGDDGSGEEESDEEGSGDDDQVTTTESFRSFLKHESSNFS